MRRPFFSGIDIIRVSRIRESLKRHSVSFEKKVFSSEEIRYCHGRRRSAEHYAARFAAKEAFVKAVSGWTQVVPPMNEIKVVHDRRGRPKIEISSRWRRAMKLSSSAVWDVSLSHEKDFAVASVILMMP